MAPLLFLCLLCAACTQTSGGAFQEYSPPPAGPLVTAQVDLGALAAIRAGAALAMEKQLHDGNLDLGWGPGAGAPAAGPYADAVPEADAAALQALRSLAAVPVAGLTVSPGTQDAVAGATTEAFKQLDGPRGGAFLLLADAAHPPPTPAVPNPVDSPEPPCPTPGPGRGTPGCLERQVSDGLLAAWYAPDTHMFFDVGQSSTVYRPVDAIAVGAALITAGYLHHDDRKIQAGSDIVSVELKNDVDPHYGLLYGLVTATAQGGHQVTDYHARLADQAGAAEALLEAFDFSREHQHMAMAQALLQPLLDEKVGLHAASGGYVDGLDLRGAGPDQAAPSDVIATLLTLQAARHYDRDDGGHFAHLEEAAAGALAAALAADARQGGDPKSGLPAAVPPSGTAARSGLATALAVTILGDVARGLGASPGPTP